jgi:hypothetical protein
LEQDVVGCDELAASLLGQQDGVAPESGRKGVTGFDLCSINRNILFEFCQAAEGKI